MQKQLSFDFPKIPDGFKLIFRSTITLKNGKVLHAKQCGIRGFPILVPNAK